MNQIILELRRRQLPSDVHPDSSMVAQFRALHHQHRVSPEACHAIRQILSQTEFDSVVYEEAKIHHPS